MYDRFQAPLFSVCRVIYIVLFSSRRLCLYIKQHNPALHYHLGQNHHIPLKAEQNMR